MPEEDDVRALEDLKAALRRASASTTYLDFKRVVVLSLLEQRRLQLQGGLDAEPPDGGA